MKEITSNFFTVLNMDTSHFTSVWQNKQSVLEKVLSPEDKRTFLSFLRKVSDTIQHQALKPHASWKKNTPVSEDARIQANAMEQKLRESQTAARVGSGDEIQEKELAIVKEKDDPSIDPSWQVISALPVALAQTPSLEAENASQQISEEILNLSIQDSILEILSQLKSNPEFVSQMQTLLASGTSPKLTLFVDLLKQIAQDVGSAPDTTTLDSTLKLAEEPLADVLKNLSAQPNGEAQLKVTAGNQTSELDTVAEAIKKIIKLDGVSSNIAVDTLPAAIEGISTSMSGLSGENPLKLDTAGIGQNKQNDIDLEKVLASAQEDSIQDLSLDTKKTSVNGASSDFLDAESFSLMNQQPSVLQQAQTTAKSENNAGLEAKTFISELVKSIRTNVTNNLQEATVQLKPEFLGKAMINIRMVENHVTLRMEVHSAVARDALDANLLQLKDALKERGFTVDTVQITLNSDTKDSYLAQQQQQPWQSHSSGQSGSSMHAVSEDEIFELANNVTQQPQQEEKGSEDNINYLI